ncbi:MAG: MFS transporter [Candidatus Dormibacteraeota bacterium]|nr:MFS transporter [Candidatus Dormibacteraeota bacterium]
MTSTPDRLSVFREVVRNPDLRRLEVAFSGFNAAEWSTWIAVLVYAYGVGGSGTVGILALAMVVPSAIVAPIAAQLGDRIPRQRVMVLGYALQVLTMGVTALALLLALPPIVIYLFATLAAMSVTVTRPAQGALLPELARTPGELVAANAMSGTIENFSICVGPALTGVLLRTGSPGLVWAVMAAVMLGSTLLVARIRHRPAEQSPDAAQEEAGFFTTSLAGIRALGGLEGPRWIVSLIFALSVELGALDVLLIVLSFQVLRIGPSGPGFLNAAIGAGGIVGLAVTARLVGRSHLSRPFLMGIAVCGLALSLVGAFPAFITAVAFLGVAGAGRNVMDVAGRTLLQRTVPDRVLSRVFGVLEGLYNISLGIGAILAPLAILAVGLRGTFLLAGVALALLAALGLRPLRALDRTAGIAGPALDRARAVTLFRPLNNVVLERLAASLRPLTLPAGSVIIREGEPGERFYLVAEGEVAVLKKEVEVARLRAGDYFGEIALLRKIPTTASVIAMTPVELLTLEPDIFIDAITGNPRVRRVMNRVVTERLQS